MRHNVGRVEQYIRLALGIAAATAMVRARGRQRGVLGALAASGITTALTRYCPINEAMGRTGSRVSEGMRDAQLRRQMAMSSALGSRPSGAGDQPPVTRKSDMFGRST